MDAVRQCGYSETGYLNESYQEGRKNVSRLKHNWWKGLCYSYPGQGCLDSLVVWTMFMFCLYLKVITIFTFLSWSVLVRVALSDVSVLWNFLCTAGKHFNLADRARRGPGCQNCFSLSHLGPSLESYLYLWLLHSHPTNNSRFILAGIPYSF